MTRRMSWNMRALVAFLCLAALCLTGMAPVGKNALAPEEAGWLTSLDRDIRIGITVIPPQILQNSGTYEGLSLDYIHLMEQKLGLRFSLVPFSSWNDVLEAAKERRIDIIFAAQKTQERLAYLNFTEPYIDLPNIILARKDREGAEDLHRMQGWSVAVAKGSAVHEYLQREFPGLELRPVPDEMKGLQQVSLGEVDAMVLEISRASYYIEKEGILNLRVAGDAHYLYQLRFAVRNDWPPLLRILDKGLAAVSDQERREINRRWIIVGRQSIFASRTFRLAFAIGLTLAILTVAGVAAWNFMLRRVVRQRTWELQQELAERGRMEEALRESENKFKGFAEQALVGLYLVQDGIFKYVNPKFAEMFGYSGEEMAGDMPISRLIHPEDLPLVEENLRQRLAGEVAAVQYTFRGRKKNGQMFFVEVYGTTLMYNGRPAALGTTLDITDRRRDEEKIRRDELRLRHLVDILQHPSENMQAFLDYALEQAIRLTESRYGYLYHYEEERQELVLNTWSRDVLAACTVANPATRYSLSATGFWGETVRQRKPIIDNDFPSCHPMKKGFPEGHVPLRRFLAAPIFQGERIVGVIGLADKGSDYEQTDVLQVSLLMEAVWKVIDKMHAEEEQKKIARQLEQARKMESIGTLAGGIAHDFNNILGAILGYAEIAREDCSPGSAMAEDLDQVILASNRAKALVKQILAFSRQNQTGKIPLNPASIVKEAIKLLRSSLPTTIRIEQHIDMDAGLVLADPTEIHQIMMNLGTNAFHAMEEAGGVLSIGLRKLCPPGRGEAGNADEPTGFLELSIADTGAGIPQAIRDRIFEPYFTTKTLGKGTGMGLSIVHGIVKNYGGEITCRSEPGQGTRFNIVLPVFTGEGDPAGAEALPLPTGSERVLLLDDERMLVTMTQNMLERLGYTVTTRTSSIEALATFEAQPEAFDIVVTDQTMPGMTGTELARRLLRLRPDLPIILCTGYSSQISEEKARACGIRGFAMKPLAMREFAGLIRKVLDGRAGSEAANGVSSTA